MLDKQYNLNEILEKLFKTGKIKNDEIWVIKHYITHLEELCNKYEEEHNTTFKEWLKDIKANKKAIEYMEENERAFIVSLGTHYYKLLEILRGEE